MKVPEKYEPSTADEFGVFSETLKHIMSVPYSKIKSSLESEKIDRREKRVTKPASPDEV